MDRKAVMNTDLFMTLCNLRLTEVDLEALFASIALEPRLRITSEYKTDPSAFWLAMLDIIEGGRNIHPIRIVDVLVALKRRFPSNEQLKTAIEAAEKWNPNASHPDAATPLLVVPASMGFDHDLVCGDSIVEVLRELYGGNRLNPSIVTDLKHVLPSRQHWRASSPDPIGVATEWLQENRCTHELVIAAISNWPQHPKLRAVLWSIARCFSDPGKAAPSLWSHLSRSRKETIELVWSEVKSGPPAE